MADWSDSLAIAQARAPLAELVNDRPSEWLHRYAVPSDMAQPLAIREVGEAAQYLPLAGPSNFPLQNATPLAFLNESGSIYTNVTNATLIYTRSTVDAGSLTPLLQKAFCDELSARIAMPLTKEPKLVQTLSIMAEQSKAKALADEENKVERHQIRYVTEAEYARQGYGA
ncbi:hypothetical protein [Novosphingobium sp. Leaf2]|uniref:hypothetical protein n=1 Tax=Novosphingobium sp. Leaf2 TaxID=1735670 RepID=UPI001F4092E4|nr:hypothetical protein [Novosphingobium sp. Leaf2]